MTDDQKLMKHFNTVLIVMVFGLLTAVFLLAWFIQVSPPVADSGIKVIENAKITVPETIRESVPFRYHAEGTKLIPAEADVTLQMECNINGAKNIVTIATFYSTRQSGPFSDDKTTAISPSSKLQSSDDCRFKFIPLYRVYQPDKKNETNPIEVIRVFESNKFKFIGNGDSEG